MNRTTRRLRRALCAGIAATLSMAQEPPVPANTPKPISSADAMQNAIAKQRLSVRRQLPAMAAAAHSFFAVPWTGAPVVNTEAPLAIQADCDPLSHEELEPIIRKTAIEESVSPALLRAIVARESGGRPCAVSNKGARGLMQLMPGTQAELGVTDVFDPEQNISGGARYLRQMLTRYKGNRRLALAAYNAGPNRVEIGGEVPSFRETQNYVADVLATSDKLAGAVSEQN